MSLSEAPAFLKSETYPIVPLSPGFVDERGRITNLTTKGARSVAVLTSKAGSSRASHVHRGDDHLSFVVSGQVEYWWQDGVVTEAGAFEPSGEKRKVVAEAGQAFYTPPWVAHTMFFPVDTTFVTVSCQSREHEDHEADLIRVPSLKDAG